MKHAISVSIAILLSLILSQYLLTGMNYWMVLTAFLVSLAAPTVPLRERVIVLVLTLTAICVAALAITFLVSIAVLILLGLVYVLLALRLTEWEIGKSNFWLLSFLLTFVLALLLTNSTLHDEMLGGIMGAFIGIICSMLVLHGSFEKEFSRGVLPPLRAMDRNLQGLQTVLTAHDVTDTTKADKLQRICIMRKPFYPEWVFNAGFNPGLRSGARFFLIKLEQAQEVLCALNYLVLRDLQWQGVRETTELFNKSLQGNRDLLHALIRYFETKFFIVSQDFTADIVELEKALQDIVPPKLELLEIAPEYLALTAFVRELKDLRNALLQLTASLPTENTIVGVH